VVVLVGSGEQLTIIHHRPGWILEPTSSNTSSSQFLAGMWESGSTELYNSFLKVDHIFTEDVGKGLSFEWNS
jgi:hypothetical protein